MDSEGDVRAGGRSKVIQHTDNGAVVSLVFTRRARSISSKDHSGWSIMGRRLVLKATCCNYFIDKTWLTELQVTIRSATDVNSKVSTNRSLRGKHKILLEIRYHSI